MIKQTVIATSEVLFYLRSEEFVLFYSLLEVIVPIGTNAYAVTILLFITGALLIIKIRESGKFKIK